jgi:hypothetical protein
MEGDCDDVFATDDTCESHGEFALRMENLVERIQRDLDAADARIDSAPDCAEAFRLRARIKTMESERVAALDAQNRLHAKRLGEQAKKHTADLSSCQRLAMQEIDALKSDHAREMSAFAQSAGRRAAEVEKKRAREAEEAVSLAANRHSSAMGEARRAHNATLERLRSEHADTLEHLRSEHADTLERLRSEHADTLERLGSEHAETLQRMRADHSAQLRDAHTGARACWETRVASEVESARASLAEQASASKLLDEKRLARIHLLSDSLGGVAQELTQQKELVVSLQQQLADQREAAATATSALRAEIARLVEKLAARARHGDGARRDWTLADAM